MILFAYISHNIDRIKYDVRIGLIPCGILKHWQIYSRYDYYKKIGNENYKSVLFTAEDMGVQENWVYCIIRKMEAEV